MYDVHICIPTMRTRALTHEHTQNFCIQGHAVPIRGTAERGPGVCVCVQVCVCVYIYVLTVCKVYMYIFCICTYFMFTHMTTLHVLCLHT